MDASLRMFMHDFLGVVAAALVPVVLVTFIAVPVALGANPGEQVLAETTAERHMT